MAVLGTTLTAWADDPYVFIRGGLANCRVRFEKEKMGRVAFLGGSITANAGWRDLVCKDLQQRFPQTKFDFVNAGVSSMGSTPGAFRFTRDVLRHGPVDLLFEEAAVNDAANGTSDVEQVRGMEGIVRHARLMNPNIDVVLLHFADPGKVKQIQEGKMPAVIVNHEKVAQHYRVPSINLADEVAKRIAAGEFTWAKDFRDLHPAPFGHRLYAAGVVRLFDAAWKKPLPEDAKIEPHPAPSEPLDPKSYFNGQLADIKPSELIQDWQLNPSWKPGDTVGTRAGFVGVPMLVAEKPGATCKFKFDGPTIGIFVAAGPDAGIVEFSVDGKPPRTVDLFTQWSRSLHLPWAVVLDGDLVPGPHELTLKISEKKNPASQGHAVRIAHFLVN